MTRRAWLVLGVAVALWSGGAVFAIEAFHVLAAVALSTLFLCLVLVFGAARGIRVERSICRALRQGEETRVALVIRAPRHAHLVSFLLQDRNPAVGDRPVPLIWVSGLEPGAMVESGYRFAAVVRGDHELGPVRLQCRDPLGLFARERPLPCPGRLLVFPRWERVERLPLSSTARSYLVGLDRSTVEGTGQEFFAVREYRHGDSLRRVHWRSTARRGQMMVRQYENETRPSVVLHIDTHPVECDGRSSAGSLDRAAAVAASLALHVLEAGSRVTCGAAGQEPRWLVAHGIQAQRDLVLQYLTRLTPCRSATRAEGVAESARALGGGDTLVAVLGQLDDDTVAGLTTQAFNGRPTVVFLVRAPDTWSEDEARFVHGLRAFGVAVVPAGEAGALELAMQVWLA